LQLNDEVVNYFKRNGYHQSIESNGTQKIPSGIDYVTVSPKGEELYVDNRVDEYRYPIAKGDSLPNAETEAVLFVSPVCTDTEIIKENLKYCIDMIKESPKWRLSVQNHKLWRIQ